jgi:hypothetical protein
MVSAQSESFSLRPKRTPALWHAGDRERQSAGLYALAELDPASVGQARHVAGRTRKEFNEATAAEKMWVIAPG